MENFLDSCYKIFMLGINNIMTKFENRFFKMLNEADELDVDREAMEASLDDGTDAGEFDTQMPDPEEADDAAMRAAQATSDLASEMRQELEGWVSEMDAFLHKLNGQEGSIQSVLASAESDTIFDRMKQSEQRKITRVATELASLTESFRGYLAQTDNPQFRGV
jgi:hypothetical protein